MKIYDCFTFFNELDILEIRLNVLDDKVDYFVLVEATKTHSGIEKELFFNKNKSRFNKFSDKIIHIIVDDMPELKNNDRWVLENFQRNAIIRGLSKCEDNDIIIISDLDEIPNLENIAGIKKILLNNKNSIDLPYIISTDIRKTLLKFNSKIIDKIIARIPIKSNRIVMLKQKVYCYFLNGFANFTWYGPRLILYKNLVEIFNSKPQDIRHVISGNIIKNGGWHFSYQFTPEDIAKKLKSFAHSEYDKSEYTDIITINKSIEKGEFIFGQKVNIIYGKIDESYPRYIINNIQKYSSHIKPI